MAFPRPPSLLSLCAVCFALVACGGSTDAGTDETSDTGGGSSDVSVDGSTIDGAGDDGATDGGGGDGGGGDGSATDGTTTDAGDDAIASDVATDGDARPVCSDQPTKNKCQNCCALEHAAGEKTFLASVLACACTDAVCKSVCATTACASPPATATDACKTCLNESVRSGGGDAGADGGSDGKCADSVKTACASDPKCVNYATCLGTCK